MHGHCIVCYIISFSDGLINLMNVKDIYMEKNPIYHLILWSKYSVKYKYFSINTKGNKTSKLNLFSVFPLR